MKITFYGARGSIATPLLLDDYQHKIKKILTLYKNSKEKNIDKFFNSLPFNLSHIYGGNTSCVSIEEKGSDIVILDAGSGLRILGNTISNKDSQDIHIFLSHTHWDHICGIPFFKPIYNPKNTVIFYSPDEDMVRNLYRQQHANHFPIHFGKLPAKKKFVMLTESREYNINGFKILNVPLNHPGGCYGYIFYKDGKKISYATDAEFTSENLGEKSLYYKACFESSDVLIMDCQYSLTEFFSKFDWGHTSSNMAVNLALDWRVKRLVLFHFDPSHSDEDLMKILEEANKFKSQFNRRNLEILQAIEGKSIEL